MHAISSKPEAAGTGLEDVFSDSVWRIARVTSPESVLKYDPRLADLGCLDCLEEAEFFASERILWVVERHGTLVATMRRSDDEYDAIHWKQPELIEIAACPSAWRFLPLWLQTPIWRRLLAFIRGYDPVVHNRPEIRRLAEATFRTRVVRTIEEGNKLLLEELVADCPFWRIRGRAELLQQQPSELRRWYRLFRLPKSDETELGIEDFVRALRHAAGFLDATADFED